MLNVKDSPTKDSLKNGTVPAKWDCLSVVYMWPELAVIGRDFNVFVFIRDPH
jgi:hypothetical protein